ncbi:MAG: hypothetical protein KAT32_03670 [Candidatus Moranbacteria bacterium]|nr:hypothetical protein [Candidatus Moranbacteria bacterium]
MKNITIIVLSIFVVGLFGLIIYFIQTDNKNANLEPSKGYLEALKETEEDKEKFRVMNNIEKSKKENVENLGKISENESFDECEKDGKVYFDIPELDISVLVNEKIKDDLVYSDVNRSYGEFVYVSSKKLIEMDLDGFCSIDGKKGSGTFGISKRPIKDYVNMEGSDLMERIKLGEVKQIGEYFIVFGRQDRCSLLDYENYVIENSMNVMASNVKCIKEIK